MSQRVPPNNQEAEEAVIGACLFRPSVLEEIGQILDPSDFYKPSHGAIFHACLRLHLDGEPIDVVSVADVLNRDGNLEQVGGVKRLTSLMALAPAATAAPRWARLIVEAAALRKLIGIGNQITEMAYGLPEDGPSQIVDHAKAELSSIEVVDSIPESLWTVEEFLERPEEERPPWVIPGQMRVGWRAVVVAAEGVGKSVLLRQIAMCVAQGVHPFDPPRRIPAVPTLIADLENPDEAVSDVAQMVRKPLLQTVGDEYDPDAAWLWHEPAGINLRSRADRSKMAAVLQHVRPKLVVMGPVYKLYELNGDSDEVAAKEVMRVLDDWRHRFGFALILEHHAPQASGAGPRKMRPYGTTLWLRWPEFGFGLESMRKRRGSLHLARFRGDRLDATWPEELHRSSPWPWTAAWPAGTLPTSGTGDPGPTPPDDEPF